MPVRLIIVPLLCFIISKAEAQSSSKKGGDLQPTSIEPNKAEKEYAPKKQKTSSIDYENAEREFQERMHDLQKTRRKNERLMDKPQYSDPLYFGHKRPPKKHKPSKMKFCKICGMRH